jgi:hypothetical protein
MFIPATKWYQPLQKCGTTPRDEPLLQQHGIFEAETEETWREDGDLQT